MRKPDSRDAETGAGEIAGIYESVLDAPPTDIEVEERSRDVLVTLTAASTGVERTLLEAGEQELVLRERNAFRAVLGPALRAAVERHVGIKLGTLTGSTDLESGTETLVFSRSVA